MRRGWLLLLVIWITACSQSQQTWHATDITHIMPDLTFSLEDDDGKPVTADSYRGKIRLLFFGYTHCPDVCPLTLGKLSAVLHGMTPEQRNRLAVLFVSVDPARDTAAVRKRYCAAFGPEFRGLSGSMAQIRKLTRRYRATFGYGEKDANGQYEVSHSSAIYVFDSQGRARLLVRGDASVKEIGEDLRQLLAAS